MVKTLNKNGNSLALTLDKALLELMNLDPEAPVVEIQADGDRLIVSAASPERVAELQKQKAKARAAYQKVKKRSFATHKKLAE